MEICTDVEEEEQRLKLVKESRRWCSHYGCRSGVQKRKQQREGEETRRDRQVNAEEEET